MEFSGFLFNYRDVVEPALAHYADPDCIGSFLSFLEARQLCSTTVRDHATQGKRVVMFLLATRSGDKDAFKPLLRWYDNLIKQMASYVPKVPRQGEAVVH